MWPTSKRLVTVSGVLPLVVLCLSGCYPGPDSDLPAQLPARSASERNQQNEQQIPARSASERPQQAIAQWDEQVARVLSGQTDRLLIDVGPITPAQLASLPRLDGRLTQLMIDAGGASDASLAAISQVKSLVHLRLRDCPLSDSGIESLVAAGMPELQILNIPQATITARGIAALPGLPKLVQLRLGGAQIDDAAIREIVSLKGLRSLHLIGPQLTDQALEHLAECELLSSFYLDDCPLSDSAWQQLFAAKPRLHVHIDQAHHDRDPNRHQE